jgi:hypothetical protein
MPWHAHSHHSIVRFFDLVVDTASATVIEPKEICSPLHLGRLSDPPALGRSVARDYGLRVQEVIADVIDTEMYAVINIGSAQPPELLEECCQRQLCHSLDACSLPEGRGHDRERLR